MTKSNSVARRPLAAAFATLGSATAVISALPVTQAAVLAGQEQRSTIVVSNCTDAGSQSLRDAISHAVSDDTIDLTQLACSTITLTTGAIAIPQNNLKIVGPGQNKFTIDGGHVDAILYHKGSGTLRLSGLSIVNGSLFRSTTRAAGGCIHSDSHLRLEDVSVSHCRAATNGTYPSFGGAVSVQGYAAIVRSTISDSTARANGGGSATGGGVYVGGNVYMRGSTITNNIASSLQPSYADSGGMHARGFVNISESLIAANHADYFGGLYLKAAATITNSTVSGNTAVTIGGIASSGPLYLYNSTIAFNNSSAWTVGAGGLHFAAGIFATGNGIISSTIIANNVNTGAPYATADLTGIGAFSGDTSNVMFCGITCPPDTTSEDPGLHPLQDNGGPTKTHAPTPGVWDRLHGNNRRAAVWDQRGIGFPRMSPGDPIEIGAFQTNSGIIFVNGFN